MIGTAHGGINSSVCQGGSMKKRVIRAAGFLLTIAAMIWCYQYIYANTEKAMKIRLVFDDITLTATMKDNDTANDFISLLPLTLVLEDYAGTEKISSLPKRLSLNNAPSGYDPDKGDITLYSPWGNIAIFYRDFGYAAGLVPLGSIDANVDYLAKIKGKKSVRIEVVK